MHINSALVSAQNRQRFYAFNWSVEQPEDRGILLKDIIETGEAFLDKSYALTTRCCGAIPEDTLKRHRHTMIAEPVIFQRPRGKNEGGIKYDKAPTLTANGAWEQNNKVYKVYEVKDGLIEINGKQYFIELPDGFYIIRKLTPTECERLQTLPDGYTAAVSDTQRYKGLGNGWTAEVIIHILSAALKDVPKDEEIVVLSMYDGIGTGRYCLDKMGFTNVTYYAYEIDEPAMKVALSNYPDIIQLGDAFNLRRDDWELGKRYDDAPPAPAEQDPESEEATDLSDTPEEIKAEIIKNDEILREREHEKETTEEGNMNTNNRELATTEAVGVFNAMEQLIRLADERKALANIMPENKRFTDDVRAIEYAVSVLEAVGL